MDDPPPLPPPGDGGPLNDMSRDGVLLEEEQREELRLVAWSSAALLLASFGLFRFCRSLSVLLELRMEQTSWRSSRRSHKDTSCGKLEASDEWRNSIEESRRRHRRISRSCVHLGLMAQKSSSRKSSSL